MGKQGDASEGVCILIGKIQEELKKLKDGFSRSEHKATSEVVCILINKMQEELKKLKDGANQNTRRLF
ncbi:hypothetical protein ACOMHN_002264 [Nucella lapillus]